MLVSKILKLKDFLESRNIKEASDLNVILSIASEVSFDALNVYVSGYQKQNISLGNTTVSVEKIVMPQGEIFISNQQAAMGAVSASTSVDSVVGRTTGDLSIDTRWFYSDEDRQNRIEILNGQKDSNFAVSADRGESFAYEKYLFEDEKLQKEAVSRLEEQLELYSEAKPYFEKIVYDLLQKTNGGTNTKGTSYDEFSRYLRRTKDGLEKMKNALGVLKGGNVYEEEFSNAIKYSENLPLMRKYCSYSEIAKDHVCQYQVSEEKSPFQNELRFYTPGGTSQLIDVGCGYYALGYGIKETKNPVFIKNENFKGRDVVLYDGATFKIFNKKHVDNPIYNILKDIDGCEIEKEYIYQKENKKPEKRKGPSVKYTPPKPEKFEEDRKPLSFNQFKEMKDKSIMEFPELDYDSAKLKSPFGGGYMTEESILNSDIAKKYIDYVGGFSGIKNIITKGGEKMYLIPDEETIDRAIRGLAD